MAIISCGIYAIKNIITSQLYIGSSNNIERRFRRHKSELRHNKHFNVHLQRSWNKYGESNFEFYILEKCNENILIDKEDEYIKKYNTMKNLFGFNKTSADRHIVTEETRRKLSLSSKRLGNPTSPSKETRIKIGLASKGNKYRLGQKHSDKTKAIMSFQRLGNKYALGMKQSENCIEKNRQFMTGKKYAAKKILQLDKEGNILNEFDSESDACRFLDKKRTGLISSCCLNPLRNKSAYGYNWRHA